MIPAARHLLRARDLVDAHYAEPLTVADLARCAGPSPAHFSREFRRAFGEPPHRYLLTRRLERAAALLRDTDRPITEVCFAVGLTSVGSLCTSFHRVYGETPTATGSGTRRPGATCGYRPVSSVGTADPRTGDPSGNNIRLTQVMEFDLSRSSDPA